MERSSGTSALPSADSEGSLDRPMTESSAPDNAAGAATTENLSGDPNIGADGMRRGPWTEQEEDLFIAGLELFGRDWASVRTSKVVRCFRTFSRYYSCPNIWERATANPFGAERRNTSSNSTGTERLCQRK